VDAVTTNPGQKFEDKDVREAAKTLNTASRSEQESIPLWSRAITIAL
jgi:hypothetical protein